MKKELHISAFLEEAKNCRVIDARSPSEYLKGHIPGAVNVPLFNDEERAEIGTLYVRKGKEEAVVRGLEIAGPKLSGLVMECKSHAINNKLLLHCWRGGMRSNSLSWLLNTAGINTVTLTGGYKSYRNFVLTSFEKDADLIIVGGETGSGKTDILKSIGRLDEQIIDLEGIANHKGSAFGALGQMDQPSVEQFENNLAEKWNELDFSKRIWLEDEAHSIGRVYLPAALWDKMKEAPILRVQLPLSERVKRLVKEYGAFDPQILIDSINKIKKRLGGQHVITAIDAVNSGNIAIAVEICLYYYDKAYNFNHEKRAFDNVHFIPCENDDPVKNAAIVLNFADLQIEKIEKNYAD